MKSYLRAGRLWKTGWALSLSFAAAAAFAAPPVVKTVPWVATNPLIPHTTWSGKSIRLKGTCDQQGANLQWIWDFGDGSPVASGTVTNRYAIEASHAYTGIPGTIFTARLTVNNTTTGETGNRAYYVVIQAKSLDVEVNVAIDEGLWYIHKGQYRFANDGVDCGDWRNWSGYYGIIAANVNALEVNGHLEIGDSSNPYTETVQRGMRRLLQVLTTRAIGVQALGNPDSLPNGYGVCLNQSNQYYQGGMVIDAIVASGTPATIAATGQMPSGANPGIRGRTYKDIVQDMVDDHAWAQYDSISRGGWRYSAQDYPDNSACQWAAIGLIAAERNWGCTIPAWVKTANVNWLAYTQTSGWSGYGGAFGYTDPGYFPWGPYASTPSGMVQMVMNRIGRGMTGPNGAPNWDMAETFMRNNFANGGGPTNAIKDYYYGMFSFVKSLLLYPYDGDEDPLTPDPTPIRLLRSKTAGVPPLDWYAAEISRGDPTDGIARTLVNEQSADGWWWYNDYHGEQYPFETAWAIMMLHRSVFDAGSPVAVAKAVPNPAVAGQSITLDGSDSFHQDSSKSIVSWEWDLNSDGVYDASGPFVTKSFPGIGTYPIKLRVSDNNVPPKVAETSVSVLVTIPPLAPTADANGPYVFCAEAKPWFLDGRKSVNPDEGRSEPHAPPYPGDTIPDQKYEWDLNNDGVFDITGPTPDVTTYFTNAGPGSYLIRLRVTDTTSLSFPSSGSPDLSSVGFGQVVVPAQACLCVTLTATPLLKEIKLTWTAYAGMHHYNVYRSNVSGGPYLLVGSVLATAPREFIDHPGVLNQVYHYVVRPAAANDDEICQSNQASAEPLHPIPTVGAVPTVVSNTGKYYYTLKAASDCFGRNQLQIFIGDTASGQVAGPYATEWLVYIRTNLAAASVRAGTGSVKAYVMTKGSARLWAVDPIGQKSVELIIP